MNKKAEKPTAQLPNSIDELKKEVESINYLNSLLVKLLKQSEKNTHTGSFIWDLETNQVVWSPHMYAIHGVSEEDYKDRLIEENRKFIHPEDRKAVERQIDEMLSAGTIRPMHFRIIRPDGKERKIISNGEFEYDEQQKPLRWMGIYQDVTETRQIERDLANRNAFIETVLQKMPIGVAVTTLSTGISSLINEKFQEIYGWPKEDIPDLKSYFQRIYPEPNYRRRARKKVVEGVMSGDPSRMQWEDLNITTKNGENRIVSSTAIPLFDQDLVISTVADYTKQYKMTEALKEIEERYKALFDRSTECICIYDTKGRFLDANQAFLKLTGYSIKELKKLEPINLLEPDSREEFFKTRSFLLRKVFDDNLREYRIVTKSGDIRTVEIRRTLIRKNQKPYAIQSFIRDISARKQVESELQKKVESLDQAERIAKLGYFEFNWQTNDYYRSQGLYKILGFQDNDDPTTVAPLRAGNSEHWFAFQDNTDPKIVASGIFLSLIHDDDRGKITQKINIFLQTHQPLDMEFRLFQKSGPMIWAHVIARTIFDDKNQPFLSIGTLQDITEKRNMEDHLRHARKMESMGTLTGGIAHEFNNILSIILGNSELALANASEGYSSKDFLWEIQKAGFRGRNVVSQLLSFTRKADERLIPLEIRPIFNEAIHQLKSNISPDIQVHQKLPETCPLIMADFHQIHQLFRNIFTNAVESIEGQGTIEASLENISAESFSEKSFSDIPPGDYVCLNIKDTGKGIESDNLDRIFDPYYTTKEFGKGPGLGLSIVHGIVKTIGGYINVESSPNQGTHFKVYFPAIKAFPEQKPASVQKAVPMGKEKLLYVDDEESLVILGENLLGKMGYQVKGCTNPQKALALVQSDPKAFDLIITDMSMPGLTGEELAKEIKKINPSVPIILCSGYVDQLDEIKSKSTTIHSFLPKPVDLKSMAQCVRAALDSI